jgi:hypothetical protein
MASDERFKRPPKTQGLTRAEYVKQIIEDAGLGPKPKPLSITVRIDAKLAQQSLARACKSMANHGVLTSAAVAKMFAVPPAMLTTAQAASSLSRSMQQLYRSLRSLQSVIDPESRLSAEQLRIFLEEHGERAYDPIGWACDAIGFRRHEVASVRIEPDWKRRLIVVEVDLLGTDWEPTYEFKMRELYFDDLPNPWQPPARWERFAGDDVSDWLGLTRKDGESAYSFAQRSRYELFMTTHARPLGIIHPTQT